MQTATFVNYYSILEVQPSASPETIRDAIKAQRRTWVKRQQAPSKERQREAEDRVRQIDEAEKVLLSDAARKEYDRELANYKAPLPAPGPSLDGSGDWLQRAYEFLARGDAQSAAYAARQATEQHGANHQAWAVRARASFIVGREQDAVFEFNEAIRIKPDADEYHFDLGSVYESKGNWNAAMQCYEQASTLAPSVPLYRVAVASVFLSNDLPERALPILDAVHKEHPDVEEFNVYLAWALNDATVNQWTHLRGGEQIITSPEQIELTKRNLQRAIALEFDEKQLRGQIAHNLNLAHDAERMSFRLPGWRKAVETGAGMSDSGIGAGLFGFFMVIGAVLAFFFGVPAALFASNPVLGVLSVPGMAWLFWTIAWQPKWKRQDKDSRGMQVHRRK